MESENMARLYFGSDHSFRRPIRGGKVFPSSTPFGVNLLVIRDFGLGFRGGSSRDQARCDLREESERQPEGRGMNPRLHRRSLCVAIALGVFAVMVVIGAAWPFEAASKLAAVAATLRGALILCLFAMAFGLGPKISYFRRVCVALSGGAMLLTVQSLLIENTPYELWAAVLATSGFLGFFGSMVGPGMWERIAKLAGEDVKG
jgi:hypothetical protein